MFSVIIGTYNHEKTLPYVFEALKGQQNLIYETIVCDDGSEDETLEIADALADHVFTQEHDGMRLAKSMNRGFEKAIGDSVVTIMGDSIPCSDLLSQYELEAKEETLLSGSRRNVLKPGGAVVSDDWRVSRGYLTMGRLTDPWNLFTGNNWCAPYDVFDDAGFWSEEFEGYGCDDLEWALRVSVLGGYKIKACPRARVYHVSHEKEQESEENKDRFLEIEREVLNAGLD